MSEEFSVLQDVPGQLRHVLDVSIGICAHNEEGNIGKLLDALLNQSTNIVSIKEIIVVSCSTDRTDEIVKAYQGRDSRVSLIVQRKRDGKAAAVNLFLKQATGGIFILESADTLPEKWTIERLVEPFLDPRIGMTGGRPIPTNNKGHVMGYVSHLLWQMHHEVSVAEPENPKCGEIIAFRNVIRSIPYDTAVDEAWIEKAEWGNGLSIRYAQKAVVHNHGPETVSDFLKQRRRIYSGHLCLQRKSGYSVATMKVTKLLRVVPRIVRLNIKYVPYFVVALFLEGYGRFLGMYDFYVKKRNPYVWEIVRSTKEV